MSLVETLEGLDLSKVSNVPPGGHDIAKSSTPAPQPNSVVTGAWTDAVKGYKGPRISERALNPPSSYDMAEKLDSVFRSTYDRDTNPNGVINLGIAENSLQTEEYLEYYGRIFKDALAPVDFSYGNQGSGSTRLHSAIANLWNENFSPLQPLKSDDIISGPGATSVLDQLIGVLLDAGEGILIAAPHYNGFNNNMVARSRANIVTVPVPVDEAFASSSLKYLQDAIKESAAKGVTVRAVMLCSPQNPYGRTYPKETLLAYATFAEENDLHLISDEVYAFSVYDNPDLPNSAKFTSMLSLDIEKETGKTFDYRRLHLVYAFSKDFGMNGFRVGAIISPYNKMVLRALIHTAMLMKGKCSVSSPADALVSYLLNDKPTLRKMIDTNQKRLAESAAYVSSWFKARGFKPFPGNAGHFTMIDGSDVFRFKSFEEEKEFATLAHQMGVYCGVGGSYHQSEPGWLRVTFSVERKTLDLALERYDKALRTRGIVPL